MSGLVEIIPPLPPQIDSQPVGQRVNELQEVSFNIIASGSSPMTYQWLLNGAAIEGATNASLTLASAQPSDYGNYSVVVSNSLGIAVSSNVWLTVGGYGLKVAFGPLTNSANGHVYCLYESSKWTEAETRAVSMGGHLVTINDAAENSWIAETFGLVAGHASYLWIGLSDQAEEGTFVWSSGEPVTFTSWASNEPNNADGIENFAYLWADGAENSLMWNDYADYGGDIYGLAEFVPRPSLGIARTDTHLVLSWPSLPEGFKLQRSSGSIGNWTGPAVDLLTNSEIISATIPFPTEPTYFRLVHP